MECTIVERIVWAIADVEGTDPLDLEYALHEYVDTEAMAKLLASANTQCTVQCEVPNHTVTVTNGDTILVDGVPKQVPASPLGLREESA